MGGRLPAELGEEVGTFVVGDQVDFFLGVVLEVEELFEVGGSAGEVDVGFVVGFDAIEHTDVLPVALADAFGEGRIAAGVEAFEEEFGSPVGVGIFDEWFEAAAGHGVGGLEAGVVEDGLGEVEA